MGPLYTNPPFWNCSAATQPLKKTSEEFHHSRDSSRCYRFVLAVSVTAATAVQPSGLIFLPRKLSITRRGSQALYRARTARSRSWTQACAVILRGTTVRPLTVVVVVVVIIVVFRDLALVVFVIATV